MMQLKDMTPVSIPPRPAGTASQTFLIQPPPTKPTAASSTSPRSSQILELAQAGPIRIVSWDQLKTILEAGHNPRYFNKQTDAEAALKQGAQGDSLSIVAPSRR